MTGLLFFYHISLHLVSCTCTCMYAVRIQGLRRLAGSDRLTWKFWNNLLTYQILFSRWFTLFLAFWLEVVVCFCFFELRTAMQCNFFSTACACAYSRVYQSSLNSCDYTFLSCSVFFVELHAVYPCEVKSGAEQNFLHYILYML